MSLFINFLKAFNGDCILISFKDDKGISRNILIDGGIDGTYYSSSDNSYGNLKTEIDNIRREKEKIDLLVLSHIDNDHIRGLLKWFEIDKNAYELIGNVWFNSGKLTSEYLKEPENSDLRLNLKIFKSTTTGVEEALDFEKYLIKNKIWDRKIIIQDTILENNGVKIQVLSPSEKQLKKLLKEYKTKTGDDIYTSGKAKDWGIDLKTFIDEENDKGFKFKQDTSVKNGSSIALLLTHNDKKFLFLADSHPKEIVKSLKRLGYNKENPLEVELFQVSHHGSKANNNKELLQIVKSNNYVISTDSSTHNHPHKRTLARIINVNPNATFYFNYKHVRDEVFSSKDFSQYKNFKAKVISNYIITQ